ncbi:MAG: hypothetical protein L6Q35_03805 [Phycisphaerales bacterium]|nr:hypothetical protein [Phycisphaerales bacterium]
MSVEAFADTFPVLTATVGGDEFLPKLAAMQPHFQDGDHATLQETRKKYSRGFWNTCGAWCFDDHPGSRASASFRLNVMEMGLAQARRAGKEKKFRKELLNNEAGFGDAIAELRLLGALGPLAPVVDQELPGKANGRNYDLHLAWPDEMELHLDSKRRDPDNEIGSLRDERRLDIEGLLGTHFRAVAFLVLRKNLHSKPEALEAAIVVDEARRVALDAPHELAPVDLANPPDWLARSSLIEEAILAQMGGGTVMATQVNDLPALYLREDQTFLIDHPHVRSVRVLSGDETPGYCVIIPAAESQPILTVEARQAWNDSSTYDRRNPESLAFKDLISKALGQLPSGPFNIIAVAVESDFDFDDLSLAVDGEPLPGDGAELVRRAHGIVHDDAYDEISGILAFTVTPPDGITGAPSKQESRYWPNPRCAHQVPEAKVKAMVEALTKSPS